MFDRLVVIGNTLHTPDGKIYRCAVGKSGFTKDKKEGDGCTPLGTYALRGCLYRMNRITIPPTRMPVRALDETDGWCDDVSSPDYNRMIKRPYDYSHEVLWRRDKVYDVIIPLGYNDDPVVKGKGSAIFMHIARKDYSSTEGCVALAAWDLLAIIPKVSKESYIEIRRE